MSPPADLAGATPPTVPPEAPETCALCPRLAAFRSENQIKYPDWHNAPVTSWGPPSARLLIVGLAPGLKGANRTGRPFTGDYAGDLLYDTMIRFGFAQGQYRADPDDGLTLNDAMVTNAVRCLPPQNKPVASEINACRPFLISRIAALPELKVILALGRIAHDSVLAAFGLRKAAYKFGHNARHEPPGGGQVKNGLTLYDSYHCSRYNTNTGRLTEAMFHDVFTAMRAEIDNR